MSVRPGVKRASELESSSRLVRLCVRSSHSRHCRSFHLSGWHCRWLFTSRRSCSDLGCFRHPWDREPCGCIATARLSLSSPVRLALSGTRDCCCGSCVRAAFTGRLCEFPGTVLRIRDAELHQQALQLILRLCWSSRLLCFESLRLRLKTLRVRVLLSRIHRPRPHLGRSSAISLNTSFRMSGGPFCTCASKLHARDFVSNASAVSPQPRLPLD